MKVGTLKTGEIAIIRDGLVTRISPGALPAGTNTLLDLIANGDAGSVLDAAEATGEPAELHSSLFDAPIRRPSAIWAAASNYRRGSADLGDGRGRGEQKDLSRAQILEMAFLKPPSAITGPGSDVVIPRSAATIFPELELCAVIGRKCRAVGPDEALDAVFGYTVILDVTARGYGENTDLKATRCVRKGFDTFAPLGPWLTTADEIPNPQALEMRLWVNDELTQSASTSAMINDVATLVSFLSHVGTLEPGDLIATGNPDSPKHQRQLSPGDVLRAEIEGIGAMELYVAAEASQ
jgi:2-keto-4-pentenoate hydratase/2-oxohepta-3-ene-1,7-dioic acid hydratase in catechol pathway